MDDCQLGYNCKIEITNIDHKWVSQIMQHQNEIALQSNTESSQIGYWRNSSS